MNACVSIYACMCVYIVFIFVLFFHFNRISVRKPMIYHGTPVYIVSLQHYLHGRIRVLYVLIPRPPGVPYTISQLTRRKKKRNKIIIIIIMKGRLIWHFGIRKNSSFPRSNTKYIVIMMLWNFKNGYGVKIIIIFINV